MKPQRINPKTRRNHDLFEISSLVQKSLRRNDVTMALYSARELLPKYENYLWKRLLTVSAEDCHDMVTHKIYNLCKKAEKQIPEIAEEYVDMALSILLTAKKSRDADYYACNLFNSRDKIDFEDYGFGHEDFDPNSSTKNGHNVFFLEEVFRKAIDEANDFIAGYSANEIKVYYPNLCWDLIEMKASSFGYKELATEVHALRKVDERLDYSNTLLFRSKAIVLMLAITNGLDLLAEYVDNVDHPHVSMNDLDDEVLQLPMYTFDCHTLKGKMMGKTKEQFVKDEYNSLSPRVAGIYDNASWERFFYNSRYGFWTKEYTPHPSASRVNEIDNHLNQPSMFL